MTLAAPTHPTYAAMADTWRTLRDAYEGSEAIRGEGTRYLPRPGGLTDDTAWQAYLDRPEWYNATARTVQGITGSVFRKPPSVQGVDAWTDQPLAQDITQTGIALGGFLREIFQETLHMGRYGVLVDLPSDATTTPRPTWAGYRTEDIVDWYAPTTNGMQRLHYLVLREFEPLRTPAVQMTAPDGFAINSWVEDIEQFRVLSLDNDGFYRVDRWQVPTSQGDARGAASTALLHLGTLQPTRRGARLDFIPFVFFGPRDLEPSIEKSPMFDLVRLNLRHWRHSADYEHGLHYTALPTPWITGHNRMIDASYNETGKASEQDSIVLGSGEALVLAEPEAKVGLLTLADADFGALKAALETDKNEMATMGARLLEDRPDIEETATALRLRHAGDESAAKTLALTVSDGATRLLRWYVWWSGIAGTSTDEKIRVTLNTDFLSVRLTGQDIMALMQLRQEGEISAETLYYQLEQGEVTQPGVSFEDEQARIQQQPPVSLRLAEMPLTEEAP